MFETHSTGHCVRTDSEFALDIIFSLGFIIVLAIVAFCIFTPEIPWPLRLTAELYALIIDVLVR